ncbi:MAG: ABC transporter permease, partial [Bdellovibrionota bacterium]
MKKFTVSPLLWPLLALGFLLLFNAIVNPAFFSFMVKNGQIYGSLVDIALRAAPLILVALGMTLVIATGGIDLSVGAVAALAGSVAAYAFSHDLSFSSALILAILTGVSTVANDLVEVA